MDEELKKLFEVQAELDARDKKMMIKVSAPDRRRYFLFFVFIVSTERHYTNKKCTGIIAPGRAHGQTQFV